jgi:hypothetical protein
MIASRSTVSTAMPARADAGRTKPTSMRPLSSCSSWATVVSSRSRSSTPERWARNARSASGTSEYIAEPTKPIDSRPSSPRSAWRAVRPASSTASRISRARS